MSRKTNGKMSPVSLTRVTIDDAFWSPRMETNRLKTIPHEYKQCKDTGRIDAFGLAWQPGEEPVPHYFWDSDVAKWIEAASYSLATNPDPGLDQLLDEVIERIAGAQQPDGYLNVYFTVVEPEKRWKNLGMWHELYCAGHLIEAAIAHYEVTGKRKLLDVACRYADYIASVFGPGPGQRYGAPGHEEIELALVKLYRVTGHRRYLDLGKFFIDQRGKHPSVFQRELEHLSPEDARINRHFFDKEDGFDTSYCQDHLPVREQSEVVGHAVRAMYLYSGMADVAVETEDEELLAACRRLWDNVCRRRMYVTGGIGPSRHNEGFTKDYDLPNETAYAETCAAIGLIFWNQRMLHIDAEACYADITERALYNGALSGVSLDGERFFYENPLGSRGDHHRQEWFGCACCPPNIARLIASLGGYVYSENATDTYIHLYISGQGKLSVGNNRVNISQQSNYPWDGEIEIQVNPTQSMEFGLNLRVPGWCRAARLWVNGQELEISPLLQSGYARIHRRWQAGDAVKLDLAMPIERVEAHPNVSQAAGCVALQRGPVVYCLEQADNPVPLHRIILPDNAELKAVYDKELLGGVVKIQGEALLVDDSTWIGELYRFKSTKTRPYAITAIPYYAWDHREPGEMRVWIRSL
ncbi:MAG: glycoside hydrolase family 127 protein [Firmicutes bacterium]|nr:glycoside hydrolase family 127 protein [Bacillota bacterium]